jgi:predicted transcriptional regulator
VSSHSVSFSVRAEQELVSEAQRLAEAKERSLSWATRHSLREWIARERAVEQSTERRPAA